MQRKTASLLLALVLFITIIPAWMMGDFDTAKKFNDTLGTILAISICACFAVGCLLFLINGYAARPFLYRTARALIGIGLVFLGCWVFGEKDRFASHPVVKTDAIITRFDDAGAYTTLDYKYQDNTDHWHAGEDIVDNLIKYNPWLELTLKPGTRIPINYLKASPDISRLVEQHYIQVYLAKGILILLGLFVLTGKRSRAFTAGPVTFRFNTERKEP